MMNEFGFFFPRDLQSKGDDHRLNVVIYRPINDECNIVLSSKLP